MISFPDWFKELCSNYVWYEPAIQHHEPETFRQAANKVYMQYVASEIFPPIQEARKHVYNVLCKIPPDKKVVKDWVTKALEKHEQEKQAEWIPVTGEERQRRLAEFKAIIDAAPIVNAMPPMSIKEQVEQGGVIPPRPTPYPSTSPKEYYKMKRHDAWIETCYDARTKEQLPGWMEESVFNLIFDEENYNEYFKLFNPKKL
jgi:hypothetical protein